MADALQNFELGAAGLLDLADFGTTHLAADVYARQDAKSADQQATMQAGAAAAEANGALGDAAASTAPDLLADPVGALGQGVAVVSEAATDTAKAAVKGAVKGAAAGLGVPTWTVGVAVGIALIAVGILGLGLVDPWKKIL